MNKEQRDDFFIKTGKALWAAVIFWIALKVIL